MWPARSRCLCSPSPLASCSAAPWSDREAVGGDTGEGEALNASGLKHKAHGERVFQAGVSHWKSKLILGWGYYLLFSISPDMAACSGLDLDSPAPFPGLLQVSPATSVAMATQRPPPGERTVIMDTPHFFISGMSLWATLYFSWTPVRIFTVSGTSSTWGSGGKEREAVG